MVDYGQKYCLECEHFYLDLGSEDWSEITPGDPACLGCTKMHWMVDRVDYLECYKERICTARTCPDFVPDPELAKIGIGKGDPE